MRKSHQSTSSGISSGISKSLNKSQTSRQKKVGEEIRSALSEIFMRGDLFYSPDLAALRNCSVTVSEVSVSPDLKNAMAYVMPLGGNNADSVANELNIIAPQIRHLLNKKLSLKFSPKLTFKVDPTFGEISRINELLTKPEVARDLELVE